MASNGSIVEDGIRFVQEAKQRIVEIARRSLRNCCTWKKQKFNQHHKKKNQNTRRRSSKKLTIVFFNEVNMQISLLLVYLL